MAEIHAHVQAHFLIRKYCVISFANSGQFKDTRCPCCLLFVAEIKYHAFNLNTSSTESPAT